jgi:probable addiction module antidote protein
MTSTENTVQRTQTTPYDSAEYLQTEEDMRLYLEVCLEEDDGDGALIRFALNTVARARGMTQIAKDTGMARESLYKALSAEGNPSFATMLKIFKALGFSLQTKVNSPALAH